MATSAVGHRAVVQQAVGQSTMVHCTVKCSAVGLCSKRGSGIAQNNQRAVIGHLKGSSSSFSLSEHKEHI